MKKTLRYNEFEREAWRENKLVCGVDEVGRGCLAGPLVTAAVILPVNTRHPLLKDSKILPEEKRLLAYKWITSCAIYATSVVSWQQIDCINIYEATKRAMKTAALGALSRFGNPLITKYLLIDAVRIRLAGYEHLACRSFPKGETYSSSIAAASIVAKVNRDRLMQAMAPFFPHYELGAGKGYGTREHLRGLRTAGPSIIHRQSFLKNAIFDEAAEHQQLLFEKSEEGL